MKNSKMTIKWNNNMISMIKRLWTNTHIYQTIDKKNTKRFRERLQREQFSILCSNCIGGMIYHRLGKKFLSPTINLHMSNTDFVYFCIYLDEYLAQELVFIPSDEGYPVAVLPGNELNIPRIVIYFNHSNSKEAASSDWNRRKSRIDRNNLYLILYNLDDITIEQLKQLESVKCRNKVVLSQTPIPQIPWSCCMHANRFRKNGKCFIDRDLFGVRTYEKHFDFVSWLNE